MSKMRLTGEVVLEWLEKWPDLPNNQLARMIYNADDNNKLFTTKDHVRTIIRYYKGKTGDKNRKDITVTKFIKHE